MFNHVCADYSIDISDSLWLIDGKLIDLTFWQTNIFFACLLCTLQIDARLGQIDMHPLLGPENTS